MEDNANIEITRKRLRNMKKPRSYALPLISSKKSQIPHEHIKPNSRTKFKKMNGMVGKIKVFDQQLSNRYDERSRIVVKSKLGSAVHDNPDKYAEDMIVVTNDIPYGYIELQVYGKWTDETFPYDSPFIYERKLKFCETTLFICFNASYDKIIMFSRMSVHPKRYRAKKYSREFIYYVPWSKALVFDTDKLSMEMIRKYCGMIDDDEEYDKEYNLGYETQKSEEKILTNTSCVAKSTRKISRSCNDSTFNESTFDKPIFIESLMDDNLSSDKRSESDDF